MSNIIQAANPSPWTSLSDADLVARYKAGSQMAQSVLYTRYFVQAQRSAMSVLHDEAKSADVVQEAFLSVFEKVASDSYDQAGSFKSYLFRSVRNRALDHERRASVRDTCSVDFDAPESSPVTASLIDATPYAARRKEARLTAIEHIVSNNLSDLQCDIFLDRQADIPFKDIATSRGISINTATSAFQYAVRNIRKMLPPDLL